MEENLSMQRHNALENATIHYLNQFGDTSKLSAGVLREHDGSALQFISIPRTSEAEYNLLSPDSIAAQLQSGLIVDVIQTLPSDSADEVSSHHIYNGSSSIHTSSGQMELTNGRHYITSDDNASMPVDSLHQPLHSAPSHLESRSHYAACMDENRKVIVNEQCRDYILPNEAPVIVLNKEATALSTMTELDLSNSFGSSYNHIDHSVLTNSSRISHEQTHIDQDGLSSLPHLTAITKLRGTPPLDHHHHHHHQHQQQHAIRYRTVTPTPNTMMTMSKMNSFPKNTCFLNNEDDLSCLSSSMKLSRQVLREPSIGPKKNLPHKKRITKKLKTISPNDDRMHAQTPDSIGYPMQMHGINHHDIDSMPNYLHSDHLSRLSTNQQHQTTSLNLTMNAHAQPIQLTTNRVEQPKHHHTPETSFSQSFSGQSIQAVHLDTIHSVQSNGMSVSRSHLLHSSQFTCEICSTQTTSQFEFYKHLKYHYEPDVTEHVKMESSRGVPVSAGNTSMMMNSNQPDMFEMRDQRKMVVTPTIVNHRHMGESVVLTNSSFVRMPSNGQDFGCIIEHEPITDDDSINDYSGHVLSGIKAEQNEFSDPEDMLESGVLDNAQRVVDSYIENGTSEVKSLIDMNENQGNMVDNDAWSSPHREDALSTGMVYDMHKHPDDGEALPLSNFSIADQKPQAAPIANNQSVIERSGDLALMYEINMNEKDFEMMTDNSPENSLLRRQLIKSNDSSMSAFEPKNSAEIREDNEPAVETSAKEDVIQYRPNPTKINIQDEFIEEEQTDSDMDGERPSGPKKKRKIYRCRRCDKVCNSKNALHYHYLSHTGERNHRCDECGKSFFASSALKVHKRLHTGDKPYECSFCNRPFRQWGDLKYHIQSRHTKEKSHQCEFCGKDFARRYSLVIHRRIHTGEKNYKCEFCDKDFRASSYLQVHRKIHTGEKPFMCTVCNKRFRVRGDLKRHSNIHERNKAKEEKLNDLGSALNAESPSTKTDLFTMDDNNTSQSRSNDTLEQLVSVIECTEPTFNNESNSSEPLKKRARSPIDYQKSPSKYRYKRDAKAGNNSTDCLAINYSTGGYMGKSL